VTKLDDRTAEYHTAMANLRHAREMLYKELRREHKKGKLSVRDLAQTTGLTYGRVGQILREE
jgi:hypothetical protein